MLPRNFAELCFIGKKACPSVPGQVHVDMCEIRGSSFVREEGFGRYRVFCIAQQQNRQSNNEIDHVA